MTWKAKDNIGLWSSYLNDNEVAVGKRKRKKLTQQIEVKEEFRGGSILLNCLKIA